MLGSVIALLCSFVLQLSIFLTAHHSLFLSLVSYLQTSSNPPSHSLTLVNPVTLLISFTLVFLDLSLYLVSLRSLALFTVCLKFSLMCFSLSVRLIVVGCARASARLTPACLCYFWENGGTERICQLTTERWIDRRWRRERQLFQQQGHLCSVV